MTKRDYTPEETEFAWLWAEILELPPEVVIELGFCRFLTEPQLYPILWAKSLGIDFPSKRLVFAKLVEEVFVQRNKPIPEMSHVIMWEEFQKIGEEENKYTREWAL